MLIALGLVQSRVHPNKTNTSCLKSSEFVGTAFYPTTHLSYLEFCETSMMEIFTRIVNDFPVDSYMFNVNNRNIRTSTANGVVLVSLLLTLNMKLLVNYLGKKPLS